MKQKILTPKQIAADNFILFAQNSYPGRVIIVGLDDKGNLIQIYAIMGRSPNSQNRIFVLNSETGEVKTDAADPAKVEDPRLIIYTAMAQNQSEKSYAVSNGHQTHDALECSAFAYGMANPVFRKEWIYEPDGPNFTPRITATCNLSESKQQIELSVARKSPFGNECDHSLYRINGLSPGLGYCITTYDGDGKPLPSFSDLPYLMPITGNLKGIAHIYWGALNEENRVSLAVKSVDPQTGDWAVEIINKYSKVNA